MNLKSSWCITDELVSGLPYGKYGWQVNCDRWCVLAVFYFFVANLVKQIGSLVQDCSIPSALAVAILQPCTKPSTWRVNVLVWDNNMLAIWRYITVKTSHDSSSLISCGRGSKGNSIKKHIFSIKNVVRDIIHPGITPIFTFGSLSCTTKYFKYWHYLSHVNNSKYKLFVVPKRHQHVNI